MTEIFKELYSEHITELFRPKYERDFGEEREEVLNTDYLKFILNKEDKNKEDTNEDR